MLSNSVTGTILKIYFGLCFVIDIFSFVLYILILFFIGNRIIKKDKFYSSSFYKLILFNGILDLIYIVEEYITFRIPQIGFFENFYINIFPKVIYGKILATYSIAQLIFASLIGITITLNRFIAIKYPIKYKYFNSGWRFILLCTWPLFISIVVFIIFYKKDIGYQFNHNKGITVYCKDLYLSSLIWQITITIHLIALSINVILNVILVYTIKKLEKLQKINNSIKKNEEKLEISLARFAVVYCTFFAVTVFVEISLIIAISFKAIKVVENIFTTYAFIQTVMVFFTPYTLLYLSYDFRQKLFHFIGISKLLFFGNKKKIMVKTIKVSSNVFKSKFSSSKS